MPKSNSFTKELLRIITVFFIALIFAAGTMIEGNFWKIMSTPSLMGQDYFKVNLVPAFILALLITAVYLIIEKQYKKIIEINKIKDEENRGR
ncbi:Uncharacterised protein [uncultured archaeon]|nr:Uncharacterised protein [uncultured archaeon]